MKNLTVLLFLLSSITANSQLRAFDNSKAILPWIYNSSANVPRDFQAYVSYDGRGNSSLLPQSILAGMRMPVHHGRRDRHHKGPETIMGVQMLNTTQDVLKTSTISASFAHQIPLNPKLKLAMGLGTGIFNMKYNYSDLVYLDQQDPLLNNGENLFNIHLNAGVSLVLNDRLFINLSAPYLLKDKRANLNEIIFRISYILPLNPDVNLITSANLDTYNNTLIMGGDIRAEWRKMISFMAGADNYKYHAGILFDVKPFSIGYTFGQNYSNELNHVTAHQISVFSHIPFSN